MRFKVGLLALVATAFACSPANKREKIQAWAVTERPAIEVQKLDPATALEAQWTMTNWSASTGFLNLYTSQNRVFARTWDALSGGRVFLTADNGDTWARVSSADTDIDILSIAGLSNSILAGTWNGLYQSTSGGTSWTALHARDLALAGGKRRPHRSRKPRQCLGVRRGLPLHPLDFRQTSASIHSPRRVPPFSLPQQGTSTSLPTTEPAGPKPAREFRRRPELLRLFRAGQPSS